MVRGFYVSFSSHSLTAHECEGVIIVPYPQKDGELTVVLVDGSKHQLDLLSQWSRDASLGQGRRLKVRWVISHYHADHFTSGREALKDGVLKRCVEKIYAPYPRLSALQEATGRDMNQLIPFLRSLAEFGIKGAPVGSSLKDSRFVSAETAIPLFDDRGARIVGIGGQYPWALFTRRGLSPRPSKARCQHNARSILVVARPLQFRGHTSLVSAGDAAGHAWHSFFGYIEDNSNVGVKPVGVLKLAHHGAAAENPCYALDNLFEGTGLAVRIRNDPRNRVGLYKNQELLGRRLHDRGVRLIDTHDETGGISASIWVDIPVDGSSVRPGIVPTSRCLLTTPRVSPPALRSSGSC